MPQPGTALGSEGLPLSAVPPAALGLNLVNLAYPPWAHTKRPWPAAVTPLKLR